PALEGDIREHVAGLEKFCDHIIGCRVVIEQLHRQHHRGNLFNVRVELALPGQDVMAAHEHPYDHAHEDAYVAARDAFRAARRQLEDQVRRRRGDVKHHEPG
ncbi:MAG: HPF/RaiA family ribosome-associated protein, partial [Gammaproteobacteria bacterium]|nr:HPF/RaiA family ribosome-associated protein [Gammaproteobacteria bacterium]